MYDNLKQFARNSRSFRPSDVRHMFARVQNHAISPRMAPEKLLEIVQALGFKSVEAFGAKIGLEKHIAESWARYGISHDAALLLQALLDYRNRLNDAMQDFERNTQIPLDSFFTDHQLP
ncbi:hypothetical protein [Terrarubrum flagellatum]|uniref:hypothetical protein n=1 Tax=Terrirubrum flagellatum TaxID=2895980 RepID=UPI003144DB8D